VEHHDVRLTSALGSGSRIGQIDILNPSIDFYGGLDTYMNAKLLRQETIAKRAQAKSA